MRCGNGSDRTKHPAELSGDDWVRWGLEAETTVALPLPVSNDDATPRR